MYLSEQKKGIITYSGIFFIICFSFRYYAPCNFGLFNSDEAIHVLMSKSFLLPRDFYYWGQNRLGSLLPMTAYGLRKIFPIHYLYICSIVQFLFLFTGFYILSREIKSSILKVCLCLLIFLPVNEYNALILVGHPYSSQLFAGSLFIYFLSLLRKYLLRNEIFGFYQFFTSLFICVGAIIFFTIGIWVSEFNAVLILVPIFYILFEKNLRLKILVQSRIPLFVVLEISWIIIILLGYFSYRQIKLSAIQIPDSVLYNKFFVENLNDVKTIFDQFLINLKTTLFFKDIYTLDSLFNWFLVLLTIIIVLIRVIKKTKRRNGNATLINSLLLVVVASSLALFSSSWLLRVGFSSKYFTPVYIVYCFTLLLLFDQFQYKKLQFISLLGFLFFTVLYCYNLVIKYTLEGPFKLYGEFRNLPKGTLIGDYWDVYKINSVAIDSLKSLPFDYSTVRTWDWRNESLAEDNFYFLDTHKIIQDTLRENILQFGVLFNYAGKKYNYNNIDVLLYHKSSSQPLSKFILKASNNQYVTISSDNHSLIANASDPSKAEVFELIAARNGNAIKTAEGKFVCADFSNRTNLIAESNRISDWEYFKIIFVGQSEINLVSSSGMFVCADRILGDSIFANRKEAREWETFKLEPK